MTHITVNSKDIPPFDRSEFQSGETIMRIGTGEIGGKASGLVEAHRVLRNVVPDGVIRNTKVNIPSFVVLTSDIFERFMERNELWELPVAELSDDRIAIAFQRADLPTEILGDLRAFIDSLHRPIAVRSSSRLEDALERPFAGVYETKMTPNNQPDPGDRFTKLVQAIKFIYAATFFKAARDYIHVTGEDPRDERMSVILQEVVGSPFHDRFYPELSGVGRTYNYYPNPRSRPEDGVVNLALGLGKTIVDGGISWPYSPARPKIPPPFASPRDMVENTQTRFWAVNMGKPPAFDPTRETEFLVEGDLSEADYDATLRYLASTYMAESDRLIPGAGQSGPRVLNFAPLLRHDEFGFNETINQVLRSCHEHYGVAVEIEFAMTFPGLNKTGPARFGLVQVRPMMVPEEKVDVSDKELSEPNVLIGSTHVLGNGTIDDVRDIVYVHPDRFDARHSRRIAGEVEAFNRMLFEESRPYLLVGFGRWGSSDPWLGIPVQWGQIGGAKIIVESSLANMNVEPSQGSHFFHNISSFRVCYFTVHHRMEPGIDWETLNALPSESEREFVRHVRLQRPLQVRVDGRTGRGVVRLQDDEAKP